MVNKIVSSVKEAVADLTDGMTVMVGGFGESGTPLALLEAVLDGGARDLTIISNNAGREDVGIAGLILARRVRRILCSFPHYQGNDAIREAVERGRVELELCPQGSLAERIRAGGAGLGGVLTPTGIGTPLEFEKLVYEIDGHRYLLERPLNADFALIQACKADRWGNLVYRYGQRNFNPLMAMAARCTVAQVDEVVELGEIEPIHVHTPGIFVKRVLQVDRQKQGDS